MQMEIDLATHKLIERCRMSLHESQLEIVKRVLNQYIGLIENGIYDEDANSCSVAPGSAKRERHTGDYGFKIGAKQSDSGSQKAAYKHFLLALESVRPGFLQKFAKRKTRSRYYIAKTPEDLFRTGASLAHTAEPLNDDWFVDVNLSRNQKVARAKIACEEAGLEWGKDAELLI